VAGLVLTETGYASDAQIPRHSHANAYISLVRQGTFTEYYGDRVRRCTPLSLAFHPPGEVHAEHFHEGPGVSFNVELEPGWLMRLGATSDHFEKAPDFHGGDLAGLAMNLHREFDHTDSASPLAIEGLTLELLAAMSRRACTENGRKTPPWVQRAWQLVQDRFHEPLTLTEVAAAVSVHPVYLATTFRKVYQCTLGDALRRRRVEFASGRLACSEVSLAEIARAAGFSDQSHFCNTFKKMMGMTPSAFRRSVRTK
jgi:AraC family transcriptional regulator